MLNFKPLAFTVCFIIISSMAFTTVQADDNKPNMINNNMIQNIPSETFILDNGLRVFLLKDDTLPIVSVNLWYNVGSKDEKLNRTGFAHLFEHLMFMGTKNVPEIDVLLESGGASNNASTREDATNYFTVGPQNMLQTMLYIEADRMQNLAADMTMEKLNKQRDVVLNERKQSYENQPYNKIWLDLPEALYPKNHPYAHPVIGSTEDIKNATVEDVIDFFHTYYIPNNATLVVAGSFETNTTISWIKEYFQDIPRGKDIPKVDIPQIIHPTKNKLVIYDNIPIPRTYFIWHSPAYMAKGDAELDIFSDILCKGKNGILVKELVHEKQLATQLSCFQSSSKASNFMIVATPTNPDKLDELENAILNIIDNYINNPAPDFSQKLQSDLNKSLIGIITRFIKNLQSIADRADAFNQYYFYNNSTDFPAQDIQRYQNVTEESLLQTLKELFSDPTKRLNLRILPNTTSKTN